MSSFSLYVRIHKQLRMSNQPINQAYQRLIDLLLDMQIPIAEVYSVPIAEAYSVPIAEAYSVPIAESHAVEEDNKSPSAPPMPTDTFVPPRMPIYMFPPEGRMRNHGLRDGLMERDSIIYIATRNIKVNKNKSFRRDIAS